jgi:hypothetical protein
MKDILHITKGGSQIIVNAGVEGCIEAEQPKSFTRSNR